MILYLFPTFRQFIFFSNESNLSPRLLLFLTLFFPFSFVTFVDPDYANDPSGCTAVAALLVAGPAPKDSKQEKIARRIIVANAGDSRSVLSYKGEAKPMSYDHKPGNKGESRLNVG